MKEIWKDVKGYEGLYEVSNLGRVKRKIGKLLKQWDHTQGYKMVDLSKESRKHKYVHRLVAKAFIKNPKDKPEINHINGIKSDNRVENLEWSTRRENINHALENKLYKVNGTHGNSKLKPKDVLFIRNNKKLTQRELSNKYSVSHQLISKILLNKVWKHL